MKIVTVLGARPQFIKASVVTAALQECGAGVSEIVVHTGQHYDASMSSVFFTELGMPEPQYRLGVGSGTHGQQTGRMLVAVEEVLLSEQPDCVLVYGDTNSTLAGALAATKLCIPVAHVEAGLRSFNRRMPEEINRILTDHQSAILFAPSVAACEQLRREGIASEQIHLVGDVMYDVALRMADHAVFRSTVLQDLALEAGKYVLCTVHRAENTDHLDRLRCIVEALSRLARDHMVVFPVHPRTKRALADADLTRLIGPSIRLTEPLGYLDMTMLERNATLIATDSGGVQKEAFFHRVPCVTLRDETEWVELIELGWNRLAPPVDADFVHRTMRNAVGTQGDEGNPYGDGQASRKIVATLVRSVSGTLPPETIAAVAP